METRWLKRKNEETGTEERFYPITHVKAMIGINNISINLLASNWSGLSQIVTVDYAKSDNTIIVSPAVNSIVPYSASGVYCSAQSDGNLTFTCNNVPTSDITVNVVIMG